MSLKSILKKPAADIEAPSPASQSERLKDERNREIALYHANLIQSQKDIEAEILHAIETLLDFPADAQSTTAQPTKSDLDDFKRLVHPFTPADYDELIEERRIDGKCGYVFCTNAPKTTAGGKLRIVGKQSGQELKVVDKAKAECWCSADCAKRALFVKVQLIEEPAWSRRGGSGAELEVLVGKIGKEDANDAANSGKDAEEMTKAMKDLAIERGDGEKPARAVGMVAETLVERDNVRAPEAPWKPDEDEAVYGSIEGYAPKIQSSKEAKKDLGDVEWF